MATGKEIIDAVRSDEFVLLVVDNVDRRRRTMGIFDVSD